MERFWISQNRRTAILKLSAGFFVSPTKKAEFKELFAQKDEIRHRSEMYFQFHAVPTIFCLDNASFLELFIMKNNNLYTEMDKIRTYLVRQ